MPFAPTDLGFDTWEALEAWRDAAPPAQQVEINAALKQLADQEPVSFAAFARATLPFALHDWQVRHLCPLIQRLHSERGIRALFHGPPQFGKSILLAQRAPAYLLGVDPLHRVGLACYNESRAGDHGAVVRDVMQSPAYRELFPSIASRIRKDAAEGEFSTTARRKRWDGQPSFSGMGLLTGFTGKGLDTLIIDDPYQSADAAESDAINERVWRFWKNTASPRIGDEANVVVMFHRYHEDDLAGRLLAEGGWEYLRLPAIADENEDGSDPTGRALGELLSPMRSREWLAAQERGAPRMFLAQFQGRPRPAEGALFKQAWFHECTVTPTAYVLRTGEITRTVPVSDCYIFQTIDWAASEKTSADWTVVCTWAVTPRKELILLHVARERHEGPEAKALVRKQAAEFNPLFLVVEKNGLGMPLTQDLIREGYPIRGVFQHRDKVSRAQAAAARYESGAVYHATGGAWRSDYEGELLGFPHGSHDDQVDTAALAAQTIAPGAAVFADFSVGLHVAPEPLLDVDETRPLVVGWAFDPVFVCVVTQVARTESVHEAAPWLVYASYSATPEDGLEAFVRRAADQLTQEFPGARFLHAAPAANVGVKGKGATNYPEAWLTFAAGTGLVSGYNAWHGEARETPREAPGWSLSPVYLDELSRNELVRKRLITFLRGRPSVLIDPGAELVRETLGGGYQWRTTTIGHSTTQTEPGRHSACATALGCAAALLFAAGPEPEAAGELRGTAQATGHRRKG